MIVFDHYPLLVLLLVLPRMKNVPFVKSSPRMYCYHYYWILIFYLVMLLLLPPHIFYPRSARTVCVCCAPKFNPWT